MGCFIHSSSSEEELGAKVTEVTDARPEGTAHKNHEEDHLPCGPLILCRG